MLFVRNCNKNIEFYTEEVKACSSNATDSTQQKQSLPSKQINFESTLKRRWSSSTFINIVSTLIFGWKWKCSWGMFIGVASTLAKRCWNNIERITLINVDDPMLFQHWLVGDENWVNVCLPELLQRWENSIESTLSMFVVLMFTRKWLNNKTKVLKKTYISFI